jgi:Ca2+-binding EF-hand superfamily protein
MPAPTPSIAERPPGSLRRESRISIDDIGMGLEEMQEWAQRQGITDGKLTPEQLRAYTQSPEAARARRRMMTGEPYVPPNAKQATANLSKQKTPSKKDSGEGIQANLSWITWADNLFYELDRNADGVLSFEEMPDNLKEEWRKWDANQDGVIELEEWRNYLAALTEQKRKEPKKLARVRPDHRPGPGQQQILGPGGFPELMTRLLDNSHKPVKVDANKLGEFKGFVLPIWFKECDVDRDGQVSLAEWVSKGGNLNEFREMDLDGDGFITVEELVRTKKAIAVPIKDAPPQLSPAAEASGAIADPHDMVRFRGQTGKTFLIEVTGRVSTNVWGTGIYTDSSTLAAAAVHAGILDIGMKGLIKVMVLEPQQQYTGSTRNGITSQSFGQFGGSYTIQGVEQMTLAQWLEKNGSLEEFRNLDLNGDGIITAKEREIAIRRKHRE